MEVPVAGARSRSLPFQADITSVPGARMSTHAP